MKKMLVLALLATLGLAINTGCTKKEEAPAPVETPVEEPAMEEAAPTMEEAGTAGAPAAEGTEAAPETATEQPGEGQ